MQVMTDDIWVWIEKSKVNIIELKVLADKGRDAYSILS